ncbi:hypothetical protein J7E78_21180 [Paenibacillus polymyxa]|nr:hypothetical protein [Paenibacillus polymyxa]
MSVLDTYVEGIDEGRFLDQELIAISIPLFDAVQVATELTQIIRQVNPKAHIKYIGSACHY